MQSDTDIIITGSGLIGLSTALLLEKNKIRSTIIDKNPFNALKINNDKRTTAISLGSSQIFKKIGIWQRLQKYSQPIFKIKVTEGVKEKEEGVLFDHKITGEEAMGYIVENKYLKRFLFDKVLKSDYIKFIPETNVKDIRRLMSCKLELITDNSKLKCDLLIGADGRNSKIRELGFFKYFFKDYKQKAYVFNITHQFKHKGLALERFFPTGPLALLPMKSKGGNKSSVVLTVDDNFSFETKESFKKFFTEKYKNHYGRIVNMSKISSYTLNVFSCLKYYQNSIVLVGDACQAIHPIAGQGFNLGLRDSLILSESIKKALKLGQKINSNLILREYSRKRFYDKSLLVGSTHNLNRLFGFKSRLIASVRTLGLNLFNKSTFLKKKSMLFAMGIRDY